MARVVESNCTRSATAKRAHHRSSEGKYTAVNASGSMLDTPTPRCIKPAHRPHRLVGVAAPYITSIINQNNEPSYIIPYLLPEYSNLNKVDVTRRKPEQVTAVSDIHDEAPGAKASRDGQLQAMSRNSSSCEIHGALHPHP